MKIFSLLILFYLACTCNAFAQISSRSELSGILTSIKNNTDHTPVEKVYFQLDKPSYSIGDTIWFKAYLFDATFLNASGLSGVLYVELVNDSNLVQKRIMLPVNVGISWGNIALDEKIFSEGNYTLRAYTNWMRNFGEEYLFKKRIFISDTASQQWLVNLHTELLKDDGKDKAHINMRVNGLDNSSITSKNLQVKLLNGNSSLYQNTLPAASDKNFDIDFSVPDKNRSNKMNILLQDIQKGTTTKKITFPFFLNGPEDIDLQFMPESGNMLSGFSSKIGFKAVGEDGKGTSIAGAIYNSKGEKITTFKSEFKGMGSFTLLPADSEIYTARLTSPEGNSKIYPLPKVKSSGTSLSITNSKQHDSLDIIISCTPDITAQIQGYYIIGQSRGVVCLGGFVALSKSITKLSVDKKNFPSGIAHFTLLNTNKEPVNERIIFIDRNDRLNINISSNKNIYSKRDSISLEILVKDKDNTPVEASFSLAVTDDNQVKADSIFDNTIVSNMLLTSDLKGTVENPGYYFQSSDSIEAGNNLDNLLLTQGWLGYNWDRIPNTPKPVAYNAEPYFSIKGKVTNIFNKPVSNSGVLLLGKNPTMLLDTVTGPSGEFVFTNIYPRDTAIFLLQAKNKNGKSFNVGIEVEDFKPPVFENTSERTVPWFVNIDTTTIVSLHNKLLYKNENDKASGKGKMLQEVVIVGKKIIKDSKNLNGEGEADLTLTAAELSKAGKITLGMLMEKNVKGFGIGGKNGRTYMVYSMRLHLVIDGILVESLLPPGFNLYEYYKNFFDYYTAEDIKGIEVMRTGKYQMSYTTRFLDPLAIPWDHVFIEVTTIGGQGPFLKKVPGVYLYKPMPFSLPKQFYAPKYNTDSVANFVDTRATIHWEPNIITNKNGKATVSFYSADHTSNYTIIIQGSDMNGNIGAGRQKLAVKVP